MPVNIHLQPFGPQVLKEKDLTVIEQNQLMSDTLRDVIKEAFSLSGDAKALIKSEVDGDDDYASGMIAVTSAILLVVDQKLGTHYVPSLKKKL